MENMTRGEAFFIVAVIVLGVGVQVAWGVSGSGSVRPVILGLFALALLGAMERVRGRARNRR
jgi:hypothetical protein